MAEIYLNRLVSSKQRTAGDRNIWPYGPSAFPRRAYRSTDRRDTGIPERRESRSELTTDNGRRTMPIAKPRKWGMMRSLIWLRELFDHVSSFDRPYIYSYSWNWSISCSFARGIRGGGGIRGTRNAERSLDATATPGCSTRTARCLRILGGHVTRGKFSMSPRDISKRFNCEEGLSNGTECGV